MMSAMIKPGFAIALMLVGLLIGSPQPAWPDGECTPNARLTAAYKEATAAEQSGNLALAFSAFQSATDKFGCDGPNPSAASAAEGWKRAGLKLAKDTEAKGALYADGTAETVTRPNGLTLNQWKGAGAFQWYQQVGASVDADRVMARYAQSHPRDLNIFSTALAHFLKEGQNGGPNRPQTFAEMEKLATTSPGDQQLQRTVGYLKDLRKIDLANIAEALGLEEKSFARYNPKETVMGQSPVDESLKHLGTAREWYDLFGDPKANTMAERAGQRGDTMMKDERPRSYTSAMRYYELGALSEKLKTLTAQANKLGDAAAKKGELAAAVEYYEIGHSQTGENDAKINELQARLAKEGEQKEQARQKAMKEMHKDEKQQQDFKKGQQDLEKELGF
jgi:hypothetical protein